MFNWGRHSEQKATDPQEGRYKQEDGVGEHEALPSIEVVHEQGNRFSPLTCPPLSQGPLGVPQQPTSHQLYQQSVNHPPYHGSGSAHPQHIDPSHASWNHSQYPQGGPPLSQNYPPPPLPQPTIISNPPPTYGYQWPAAGYQYPTHPAHPPQQHPPSRQQHSSSHYPPQAPPPQQQQFPPAYSESTYYSNTPPPLPTNDHEVPLTQTDRQPIHRDVSGASYPKRPRSERSDDISESNHSENSSNISRSSSFASNYGEPTDVGTSYRGGKRSALSRLERRLRKNAQSRSRATKLKDRVEQIKLKSVEERTEEEMQVYTVFEERRQKKNERSRQRAVEKKTEIARIMAIPESERSEEEIHYLEVNLTAKQRKNEGDRLRRERLKQQKAATASMGVKRKDNRRPFYPKYEFPPVTRPPSIATITESKPTMTEEPMNMDTENDRIITEGMRRVDVNNTKAMKPEDQSIPSSSSQTAMSSQSIWSTDPSTLVSTQLTGPSVHAAPTSPLPSTEVFPSNTYHSPTGQDDGNFNIASPGFAFPETPNPAQIPHAVTNHDVDMIQSDGSMNNMPVGNPGPHIVMPQRPPPSPIQTGMYTVHHDSQTNSRSARRLLSLGRRPNDDDRAHEPRGGA